MFARFGFDKEGRYRLTRLSSCAKTASIPADAVTGDAVRIDVLIVKIL